eukprot:5599307-Prymnesium_polylepis.2
MVGRAARMEGHGRQLLLMVGWAVLSVSRGRREVLRVLALYEWAMGQEASGEQWPWVRRLARVL